MGGTSKDKQMEELNELEKTSTADLSEAKKVIESGDRDTDVLDISRMYADRTLRKEDKGSFLENYEINMVSDEDSVSDGVYVFYMPGVETSDGVKQAFRTYNKSDGSYPVKVFYMSIEDSAIAGFSLLAHVTGDEDVWSSYKYPLAVFVKHGSVVNEYTEVKQLEELPNNYGGSDS